MKTHHQHCFTVTIITGCGVLLPPCGVKWTLSSWWSGHPDPDCYLWAALAWTHPRKTPPPLGLFVSLSHLLSAPLCSRSHLLVLCPVGRITGVCLWRVFNVRTAPPGAPLPHSVCPFSPWRGQPPPLLLLQPLPPSPGNPPSFQSSYFHQFTPLPLFPPPPRYLWSLILLCGLFTASILTHSSSCLCPVLQFVLFSSVHHSPLPSHLLVFLLLLSYTKLASPFLSLPFLSYSLSSWSPGTNPIPCHLLNE